MIGWKHHDFALRLELAGRVKSGLSARLARHRGDCLALCARVDSPNWPLLDPLGQGGDLFGRQLRLRRHLVEFAVIDGIDEQTLFGPARRDRRSGQTARQRALTRIEPQTPLLFCRPVTSLAPLDQNRPDTLLEELDGGGIDLGVPTFGSWLSGPARGGCAPGHEDNQDLQVGRTLRSLPVDQPHPCALQSLDHPWLTCLTYQPWKRRRGHAELPSLRERLDESVKVPQVSTSALLRQSKSPNCGAACRPWQDRLYPSFEWQ